MDMIVPRDFDFIAHYKAVKKRIADASVEQKRLREERERMRIAEIKMKAMEQDRKVKEIAQSIKPMVIDVLREIAFKYQVSPDDVRGRSRMKEFVAPRQEFCWVMNKKHGWSLPQIGRFLGRDHTTVLHGVRTHAEKHGL